MVIAERQKHTDPTLSSPAAPPIHIPLRIVKLHERAGDRLFRYMMMAISAIVVATAGAMFWQLWKNSRLAWKEFGFPFIIGRTWDPVQDIYGALPFIYGTVVSSAIALLIAIPLGLGSALFLSEMAPRKTSNILTFFIELLAAIPSVILGLMGIFILVPTVKYIEPILIRFLGFLPLFKGSPYGIGLLTAGMILSIMILPYITTISRDVILSVPRSLKEGALALGATHWEMVRLVILPFSKSAIVGAIFLALGRALGETMAVTMVIGNTPKISASLLDPAYSMSAVLANEFAEATSDLQVHSLIAIGLILFFMTILVNGLARLLIGRAKLKGAKK